MGGPPTALLRVGVDAGVAGGEEVLHGADVVDGDVQDVDLGQLLALAAPRQHRVRDLPVISVEAIKSGNRTTDISPHWTGQRALFD